MKIGFKRNGGSVLVVILVITGLMGVTLASYLHMVSSQNLSIMRSMAWGRGSIALFLAVAFPAATARAQQPAAQQPSPAALAPYGGPPAASPPPPGSSPAPYGAPTPWGALIQVRPRPKGRSYE